MANFTEETWRESAAKKLAELGNRFKSFGRKELPYIAYGTVAGLTVWPLVETAISTGQLSSILGALYSTAAGIGANLIANRIEAWKDGAARPTEDDVIEWAAQQAGNADLRTALDAILERLEAVPRAIAALDETARPSFAASLRGEAAQLGNLTHIDRLMTEGGSVIIGDVSAEGSVIMMRDNYGVQVLPGGRVVIGDDTQPDPDALRIAYLNYVWRTSAYLSLGGVDPRAAADAETRLELASVYTALLTTSEREAETMRPVSADLFGRGRGGRSAVEELDRRKRLVLLGEPGSGKSTLAAFVALCLAGQALDHPITNLDLLTAPLPDDRGGDEKERQPWRHGALLPMPIVLRDLAASGHLPDEGQAGAQHLWSFLLERLEKESLGEYVPHLRRELREQGGLVLFDGLDEVPEAESRRVQIKQVVESFASVFPRCRIVVTSRTYAYQNQDWRLPEFNEAVLAPFSEGQIRRFVERWYGYIGGLRHMTADDARGRAQLLQGAIFGSDRLIGLAERPLLLTLMASLHAWRGGSLPEKREELYHDAVDLLLDWWENQRVVRDAQGRMINVQPSLAEWLKVDRDRVRELLNELAYNAHTAQPELVGTADIAEEVLVAGLLRISENPDVKPKRLVDYLSHRAGLLVPRGVKVYTFPHRTFQEYLAACYLTDHDFPELVAQLAREDLNRWREAALLAAAKAARGSKPTVWLLADALCFHEPGEEASEADARGALLAGQVLLESADLGRASEANQAKLDRVHRWQSALLAHPALPDVERAAAGRSLAELGDDRPEVVDVDAMQFCLVPGGDFWMGSDEGDEIERPLHPNKSLTYDYWLGRYPVTNAQFEAFVSDKGYERVEFWPEAIADGRWSDGEITDWNATRSRPYDYVRPFSLPNHPIIGITWYEALAFTRWLTARWRAVGLLSGSLEVRLPSEAEWEKGARGGALIPAKPVIRPAGELAAGPPGMIPNPDPDRVHPWIEFVGPRLANTSESAINSTSAAGLFPLGASPYGCEEMAGTVWEWTRSLWGTDYRKPSFGYPYEPDDGREDLTSDWQVLRVLRGGAYYNEVGACRCALRNRFDPNFGLDDYGFRALVAPS